MRGAGEAGGWDTGFLFPLLTDIVQTRPTCPQIPDPTLISFARCSTMNMVFQGTVIGPILWNNFFSIIAFAVPCGGEESRLIADDLNVFKKFALSVPNEEIAPVRTIYQREVHRWGHSWGVGYWVSFPPPDWCTPGENLPGKTTR